MALTSPTHGRLVLTNTCDRLKAFLPDWKIEGFPCVFGDKEKKRVLMYHTIWVAQQLRTQPSEQVGPKAQSAVRDRLDITLTYFNKDLQSHEPTIDVCEWTRDILTLFQPTPECSGLQSNGYNYVALVEGFWVYQQTFSCNRTYARRSPLTTDQQ